MVTADYWHVSGLHAASCNRKYNAGGVAQELASVLFSTWQEAAWVGNSGLMWCLPCHPRVESIPRFHRGPDFASSLASALCRNQPSPLISLSFYLGRKKKRKPLQQDSTYISLADLCSKNTQMWLFSGHFTVISKTVAGSVDKEDGDSRAWWMGPTAPCMFIFLSHPRSDPSLVELDRMLGWKPSFLRILEYFLLCAGRYCHGKAHRIPAPGASCVSSPASFQLLWDSGPCDSF